MLGILPIIFALILADSVRPQTPVITITGIDPTLDSALVWTAVCACWFMVISVVARAACRHSPQTAARVWEPLTTGAALGLFTAVCASTTWSWHGSRTLVVIPFLALLAITWRGAEIVYRAKRSEAWESVRNRVRFVMLPVLVFLLILDGINWLVVIDNPQSDLEAWIGFLVMMTAPVVAISVAPPFIAALWRTRKLTEGDDFEFLVTECKRSGVRVAGVRHWPSIGRFYNAAVLGILPWLRYVLFSDDLLRDLDRDELRAVLGHELGHIIHRHIWIYLLFFYAVMFWSVVLAGPLVNMLAGPTGDIATINTLVTLGLAAFFLRVVFGFVSRTCERQADLAGVDQCGSPHTMARALYAVAVLSGQPLNAPSWRHYSIAERIDFLEKVDRNPAVATLHHRRARKQLLVILLALVLGPLALWQAGGPIGSTMLDDATVDEILASDPARAAAFELAENGDASALRSWLEHADDDERQLIAAVVFHRIRTLVDPRDLYAQRHVIYPVMAHPPEHAALVIRIANLAAYTAAAGTREQDDDDKLNSMGDFDANPSVSR